MTSFVAPQAFVSDAHGQAVDLYDLLQAYYEEAILDANYILPPDLKDVVLHHRSGEELLLGLLQYPDELRRALKEVLLYDPQIATLRILGGSQIEGGDLHRMAMETAEQSERVAVVSNLGGIDLAAIDGAQEVIFIASDSKYTYDELYEVIGDKLSAVVNTNSRELNSRIADAISDDVVAFPGALGTAAEVMGALAHGHQVHLYYGENGTGKPFYETFFQTLHNLRKQGLYPDSGHTLALDFDNTDQLLANLQRIKPAGMQPPMSYQMFQHIREIQQSGLLEQMEGRVGILGASRYNGDPLLSFADRFDRFILAPNAVDIHAMQRGFRMFADYARYPDNGKYHDKPLHMDLRSWQLIFGPMIDAMEEHGLLQEGRDEILARIGQHITIDPGLSARFRGQTALTGAARDEALEASNHASLFDLTDDLSPYWQQIKERLEQGLPIVFCTTNRGKMAELMEVIERQGLPIISPEFDAQGQLVKAGNVYFFQDFLMEDDKGWRPKPGFEGLFPHWKEAYDKGEIPEPVESPETEGRNDNIANVKMLVVADRFRYADAQTMQAWFPNGFHCMAADITLTIEELCPNIFGMESSEVSNGWLHLLEEGVPVVRTRMAYQDGVPCPEYLGEYYIADGEVEYVAYGPGEEPRVPHFVMAGENFDRDFEAFPGIYVGPVVKSLVKLYKQEMPELMEGLNPRAQQLVAFHHYFREHFMDPNTGELLIDNEDGYLNVVQCGTAAIATMLPPQGREEQLQREGNGWSVHNPFAFFAHSPGYFDIPFELDLEGLDVTHALDALQVDPHPLEKKATYESAMEGAFETMFNALGLWANMRGLSQQREQQHLR